MGKVLGRGALIKAHPGSGPQVGSRPDRGGLGEGGLH